MIEKLFGDLQRDAIILMTSRGVRAFAFSYLSVVFTIYLSQLGYSTMTVGLVVTIAYASGAVLTALWGYLSDRYGRKNILMLLGVADHRLQLSSTFSSSHLIFIIARRHHRQCRRRRLRRRRPGRRPDESGRTSPARREMHGGRIATKFSPPTPSSAR